MNPELERKLAQFLEGAQSSRNTNGEDLREIKRIGKENAETLVEVKTEVVRLGVRLGAIEQSENRCRADVVDRLKTLEEVASETAEHTGRQELARVQERLKDTETALASAKASKSDWFAYSVKTAIGVTILLFTGAMGWLIRAAFHSGG